MAPPSEARVSCGALSAERLALIQGRGQSPSLRELPIGGQNADLGGVFVTSFGEGVHHVAPALPENS